MFVQSNPEGNLAQFHWPEFRGAGEAVANLANAIARQRIAQTQNFQNTLGDSIRQMAAERSANAALDQAGAMGLPDPGALKGTGITGLQEYGSLAKLIEARKLDDLREQLYGAHAGYYERGNQPRDSAGGPGNRVQDPDTGEWMTSTQLYNRRKSQADLLGKQAGAIQDEGVTGPMAHGYVMKDGKMVYAATPEEQANPELVSPGDPLDTTPPTDPKATPPPIFTPQYQQAQTAQRQKLLQQQQGIQAKMLNTPPDAGADTGGGAGGTTRNFPPSGTKGTIGGKPVVSDGYGWLPDTSAQ